MISTLIVSFLLRVATASEGTNFNYKNQGRDWGDTWPLCKNGEEQSPINLTEDFIISPTIAINLNTDTYKNYQNATIVKGPASISSAYSDGQMILTFASGMQSSFKAFNLHFHSPSEHTINGVNHDLEVHFVHTYDDGSLGAVIGVFFDRKFGGSQDNFFIDQILPIWKTPTTSNVTSQLYVQTFLKSLDLSQFFSYYGSLTTPPCTQGIKWSVIKQVQPISERQLLLFKKQYAGNTTFANGFGNNREVQPLRDRIPLLSGNFAEINGWWQATIILAVFLGVFGVGIVTIIILVFRFPLLFRKYQKVGVVQDPTTQITEDERVKDQEDQ